MGELRQSMEAEKAKTIADFKKQAEIEKQKAITETKKKQWCANCGKEAIFYCCWNTSYCDYPCQQSHWPTHMSTCAQNQSNDDDTSSGAESSAHSTAAFDASVAGGHFLNSSVSKSVAPNSLGVRAGMQGGPAVMSMAPIGVNPRLITQMGIRFPTGTPGPGTAGHIRSPVR